MNIDREMIEYLTRRSVIMPAIEGGCWLWEAFKGPDGYGQFFRLGRTYLAHRESMRAHGYNIEGLTVDHLCVNKACWNPIHLEMVSRAENTRRAANARWGVYRKLHELEIAESMRAA